MAQALRRKQAAAWLFRRSYGLLLCTTRGRGSGRSVLRIPRAHRTLRV